MRASTAEARDSALVPVAAFSTTVPSPAAIAAMSDAELPSIALALAAAQAAVAARLVENARAPRDDAYLTVEEVAEMLGVDPAWVYRQAAEWPFAVKLSSKVVRIERAGLRRWLALKRR